MMITARPILSLCALAGLLLTSAAPNAAPNAPSTKALEAEIAQLSKASGGVVGVAAWMLDGKGPRVLVNGSERFPMASTFKIAVAGAIFAGVEAGRLQLNQLVAIEPDMFVPSEVIADRFIHPGVSLSVHNLLELMLTQSDNTATDVLTHLAGGPAKVTEWIRQQGVKDQRLDRDTAALLREFFGLPAGPLQQAMAASGKDEATIEAMASRSNPSFDDDPRDTSTPEAMAQLLTRIFNGAALSASSTHELIEIMKRCRTGEGRLKGRLPPGTVVAHKTGTIGGTVNDVGTITLPGDAGQVVIAVFVKKSDLPYEQREHAIAEIARSVRDYYLFARSP
jgi:beta-lactamase class A